MGDAEAIKLHFTQYVTSAHGDRFRGYAYWDAMADKMVATISKEVWREKLGNVEVEFYFPATWYDHFKQTLNRRFNLDLKVREKRHTKIMDFYLEFPDFKPRPGRFGNAVRVVQERQG